MSVKKFKFVSPGIFINEIDNSQVTKVGSDIGPVIIGRTLRGPAMRPVEIQSFSDFIETFGEPVAGGVGGDVWRDGNRLGPTYAAYAAQAYLRNASPITFVRLLGETNEDAASNSTKAGWKVVEPSVNTWDSNNGATGAYGLFIANGGAEGKEAQSQFVLEGVISANHGFALTVDTGAVVGAATEISADHAAVTVTIPKPDANNFNGSGAAGTKGVQQIALSRIGAGNLTRSYTMSSNIAADVVVDVTATGRTTAELLCAHIKSVDGDLLECAIVNPADPPNDPCVVIIREKTRGSDGTPMAIALSNSGGHGGSAANTLTAASAGHVKFDSAKSTVNSVAYQFTGPMTAGAMAAAADGAISIAKECEALSIHPGDLTSENVALDLALGEAIATEITANTYNGINYTASAAQVTTGSVSTVVTVSKPAASGTAAFNLTDDVGTIASNNGTQAGTVASYAMNAALSAIIYVKKGAVSLVGKAANTASTTPYVDAINTWVKSDGSQNQFRLRARNKVESVSTDLSSAEDISFSFDRNSRLYIRNVLNTNPTLCNSFLLPSGETGKLKSYFLGQTFDRHLDQVQADAGVSTAAGEQFACLVPLEGAADNETSMSAAMSPWVISQHNGDPQNYDLSKEHGHLVYSGKTSLETMGIEKLFRFSSLYSGEWERKNLKISIYDIKAPTDSFNPYGSFSVMIRKSGDLDSSPQVVERFSSCNLNPASPDFIAKKIGDMESVWDTTEKRYVNHGLYPNQSRFIRVVLASSVESGAADPRLLPFGFIGPVRRASLKYTTNNSSIQTALTTVGTDAAMTEKIGNVNATIDSTNDTGLRMSKLASPRSAHASGTDIAAASTLKTGHADFNEPSGQDWVVRMEFPSAGVRKDSKDTTLSSPRDAFWGVSSMEYGSSSVADGSYADLIGYGAAGASERSADPCALSAVDLQDEFQFIFTLDDIKYASPSKLVGGSSAVKELAVDPNRLSGTEKPKDFEWVPGCHARDYTGAVASGGVAVAAGDEPAVLVADAVGLDKFACSITAYEGLDGGTGNQAVQERGYEKILDLGVDKFTLPLCGGNDGLDLLEIDPFGYHKSMTTNGGLVQSGDTILDHYALNSIKKAIDTVSDPEVVEMNILTLPGLVHPSVTSHAVATCEARGDALAIIDIDGDYQPAGLDARTEAERLPVVSTAITELRKRSLNSSYGCAFFPWVQISDSMSGRVLWSPPSVVALGTMASSTKKSELWFAPAGFTRGGLTDGAAGIGVNGVRLRLNSKERDKLYEANINPIAQFPAEGIVIFGQKTLQLTPSALDRINVRRLMIFLKKQISRFAKTVLFDQNVQTTWTRFISKCDPFLASVKARFGLTEYKIILDETTTTAELIDRNIMYAKILLKPAKAIEYIAIDFVITDSGASFDD